MNKIISLQIMVDNLVLSIDEHSILKKNKLFLESRYRVQINMPEVDTNGSCVNDVIVASISGDEQGISSVKKYLNRLADNMKRKRENNTVLAKGVEVITLSDSDTDPSDESAPAQNRARKTKKKARWSTQVVDPPAASQVGEPSSAVQVVDLSSTINLCDVSICDVTSTTETDPRDASANLPTPAVQFIPLNVAVNKKKPVQQNVKFTKKKRSAAALTRRVNNTGVSLHVEVGTNKENDSNEADNSVVIIEDEVATPEIPRPVKKDQRLLRPVVIDGSNVAREHGKSTRSYSCKGIKLSVEFFLRRGHTQVTAFVPQFRRHCRYGAIPTTDQPLLEELAINQYVVFTPSRRVEGKLLSSYDDRFIVELASQTGGVILSNDNYRDLLEESEAFKKAILERLLMFCFVGDILMIPNDPLGRAGPCLNDYLSFPAEAAISSPT